MMRKSPKTCISGPGKKERKSTVQTNCGAMLNIKWYKVYWGRKSCCFLESLRKTSWREWHMSHEMGRGREDMDAGSQSVCLAGAYRPLGWWYREKKRRGGGKVTHGCCCQAKAQGATEVSTGECPFHNCALGRWMGSGVLDGLAGWRWAWAQSLLKRLSDRGGAGAWGTL